MIKLNRFSLFLKELLTRRLQKQNIVQVIEHFDGHLEAKKKTVTIIQVD